MHKRLLYLILITTVLKELVWAAVIPLWHFPDEQSHVGQVAYLAEIGKAVPNDSSKNLTDEILQSEILLGTERDQFGINRFTYHPDYHIRYSISERGPYEEIIDSFAKRPDLRKMVKQESSKYPSFYYAYAANFYLLFSSSSLIMRVFIMRCMQIIFFVGTVYIAYLIGRVLFGGKSIYAASIPILVSFQPMFSFVGAGVNSDNAGNFIFSFYTYMLCVAIKRKFSALPIFLLAFTMVITMYFKPQFIIVIPMTLLVLIYGWRSILFNRSHLKQHSLVALILLGLLLIFIYLGNIGPFGVIIPFIYTFNPLSIFSYLTHYAASQIYHEVLPWYWGIYDWLGVTYPRPVHRIINWICLICICGFCLWSIQYRKKWPAFGIFFMVILTVLLGIGIYLYDWLSVTQTGIHLGVQGRYFFPSIVTHMVILIIGWSSIVPKKFSKFRKRWIIMLPVLMMILNFYALIFISDVYYDHSSLQQFLLEISQYKPLFFKGGYLAILFALYGISLVMLLVEYIRYGKTPQSTS
jgi:hypothetical protein